MLHTLDAAARAYGEPVPVERQGPVIASTEYVRSYWRMIRQGSPDHYGSAEATTVSAAATFGHALSRFFEVRPPHVEGMPRSRSLARKRRDRPRKTRAGRQSSAITSTTEAR